MCLVCPTPCAVRLGITGAEHTHPCWYLCWYLFQRGKMCLVCPTTCAVRLGITGAEHTRPCWYLCWYLFRTVIRLVSPGNVSLIRARTRTVSLVKCFAWSVRAMYLLARVRTCTGTSCAVGQHGRCIYLPVSVMYLRVRTRIRVLCFVMGNPSHIRILVFGLSRCNCSATPTDMDSLLVMSRDGFYVRCICAGCLYLTCRGAIVCLPVCTANREGWQPRLIYTMYIIHHVHVYIYRYIWLGFELTSPQPRSVYNVECCWCALKALLYVPSMLFRPCAWLCNLDICLLILILL